MEQKKKEGRVKFSVGLKIGLYVGLAIVTVASVQNTFSVRFMRLFATGIVGTPLPDDIKQKIANNKTMLEVIADIMFVIAFIIAYFVFRGITRGIKEINKNLTTMSEGVIKYELPEKIVKRKDEIGLIAVSLGKVVDSFRGILDSIKKAFEELGGNTDKFTESFRSIEESIENVNSAVEEISNSAASQANETQLAAEGIESMAVVIEETVQCVENMEEYSSRIKEYSKTAQNTFGELDAIGNTTYQSFQTVKDSVDKTNDSVEEISSVLNIINDIASQTNLLSLNASIEAARAGEAGKGFAVVADEIRKLAEQSANSVSKIHRSMEELAENSTESMNVIDHVAEIMEKQNDKLKENQRLFGELIGEIEHILSDLNLTKQKSSSLESLKDELGTRIKSLGAIAEQNAANTKETEVIANQLKTTVWECGKQTEDMKNAIMLMEEKINSFRTTE